MPATPPRLGPVARLVGAIGEQVIYLLIRLLGRRVRLADAPWLAGPCGSEHIGDAPYAEVARREGLEVVRDARNGGLVEDFDQLDGAEFPASSTDPAVRDFYERTGRHRLDVWAHSPFPLSIGLWLLVTTISRRVDQLNFPLGALETAQGMVSEIVQLRDTEGAVRYTGWFRKTLATSRVIYTGFYSTEQLPNHASRVVKVVFPMPGGNATVLLRPTFDARGRFELVSQGKRFGDAGFYRIAQCGEGELRVWRVRSLVERIRVYTDSQGDLRCDHSVRFWGLPALTLHYRMTDLHPS